MTETAEQSRHFTWLGITDRTAKSLRTRANERISPVEFDIWPQDALALILGTHPGNVNLYPYLTARDLAIRTANKAFRRRERPAIPLVFERKVFV